MNLKFSSCVVADDAPFKVSVAEAEEMVKKIPVVAEGPALESIGNVFVVFISISFETHFNHLFPSCFLFYSGQVALRPIGEVNAGSLYRHWESSLIGFQLCLVNQVLSHCSQWINNSIATMLTVNIARTVGFIQPHIWKNRYELLPERAGRMPCSIYGIQGTYGNPLDWFSITTIWRTLERFRVRKND